MNATPARPPGRRAEILLKILLRYIGSVSLLALVAVFMPFAWMEAAHLLLDMGTLPTEPVTSYLARSLSLFYALLGLMLWYLSFNPRYYRSFIRFFGLLFLVFGSILIWIDFKEGMPRLWRYTEGPIVIFFGSLIVILASALKPLPAPGPHPLRTPAEEPEPARRP